METLHLLGLTKCNSLCNLEDIPSWWSLYHVTLLVRMQFTSYAHINQIYSAIHCVLYLSLQFQQCAKEVVAYIFLYVHDIKIVGATADLSNMAASTMQICGYKLLDLLCHLTFP